MLVSKADIAGLMLIASVPLSLLSYINTMQNGI